MKINKQGFTLIELLVVIAIIGILAGIVLVSLSSVRERATITSARSTAASITTIASLCVNEGGHISSPTDAGTAGTTAATGAGAICDITDITEEYPTLANINGAEYAYTTTDDTNIILSDGTNTITCYVATGNCD